MATLLALALPSPKIWALEKWEGSDDFSSASVSNTKWTQGKSSAKRDASWFEQKVVYTTTVPDSDNSAAWAWGGPKKMFSVSTFRSWEISCEALYPEAGPSANLSDAVIGLSVGWFPNQKAYRAVYGRIHVSYDAFGNLVGTARCESDFNFELRASSMGGGPAEEDGSFPTGYGRFGLKLRHNALTQTDRFEVMNLDSNEVLYSRTDTSTLSLSPMCGVAFFMELDDNRIWPGLSNNMAVDNWKMEAFTPDPINLNSKTSISKGVNYSVAVTNLGMAGAKLSGTVALTVGSASATLPITGSIDKNGYFALAAKGTGATKGYGCVLLYDVATGTYRPNKNTVTAPKQKAIKF
ncbi:MAG: hypothetical protein EBZ07_06600 [Verrucomicrobia bacterium]|nr:hypothetical protein [Verrucomicrobiota bacterium]